MDSEKASKTQDRFDELVDESVKMVRPVITNLGELLEAIFLAKGQKPDSTAHRCVNRTMGFIFSCIWDGQVNDEKSSSDEGILGRYIEFLSREELSKQSWRELWSDWLFLYDTPLGTSAKDLLSYAYDGEGPNNQYRLFDENVTHEEYVRKLVEAAKVAVATIGLENPATRPLSTVLLAAKCRLALDQGRDATPEQLAALARIEIKSMRNALAPSSGSGLKLRDGAIAAESALIWLHARGNYEKTWWYDEKSVVEPVAEPISGEVLFVPFASDDIEFHPVKCRRDGKFTVGPKGAEQTFTDYRAALNCLARMKPASYWKHPNKANNWGTVTAVGFRPRTAEELDLQPAEGGEK
jgi:hypothetical protein